MASLFKRQLKRNWTYVLQWYEDGRVRTRHLGHISKTTAGQIKKKLETDLLYKKHGVFPETKPITLKEISNRYINSIKIDHAPTTIDRFLLAMNSLIGFLGNINIDTISVPDIEGWRIQRGISPTSINIEFRTLKTCFNKAVQ